MIGGQQQILYDLGVALAIGLLIGIERGWHEREAEEGERIAGVRTYGLLGLLGGILALIAENSSPAILGFVFVALTGGLSAVYIVNLNRRKDSGITSLVAALLTFSFGVLAVMGQVFVAAAGAVVTVLLLGYKLPLHGWIRSLRENELRAGIKLLLISVVLLPILPNRGYGPWQTLNPYELWWMVVIIAAISFAGYFAVKIGGTRKGIVFTGIFGGLASSTALVLHFSRLSRRDPSMTPALVTGTLLSCGTMFPRMVIVANLINQKLFQPLLPAAAVMAGLVYGPAIIYWLVKQHGATETETPLKNPLELKTALQFGLLLAIIMLLGAFLRNWLGEKGIFALAAVSGVANVDAITLSFAKMSQQDLQVKVAAMGIIVAAAVNTMVKGAMAMILGGHGIGLRVALPLAASSMAGLLTGWFILQ